EGLAESPPRHENSCELALIYAITAVEFAYSGTMTIYQVEPSRGFPWQAWVQINEHITIAWDETRGGTRAGLEPIIEVCQALELRELTPAA
ncbi:MAG: hypothetical protein Q8O97_03520, partial [bacterium]|nr:hypothetical protein [bacterium]